MEVLRKFIKFLAIVVYSLIVIYILILVPRLFNYHEHIVMDDGMEPVYSKYTIVYYYETSQEYIKLTSIITYKDGDNILTGEVYDTTGGILKVKRAGKVDNIVKYEDVLGKNSNIIVHLGKYILFVRNNTILSIIIALTIITTDIIFSVSRKKSNKKKVLDYE